ncbi:MAG: hypothetical protein HC821_01390, partial [Lewinella sp.]|nr:hypothetical protein [Lewinella sp.]
MDFFNQLQDFFAAMNHQESLFFLVSLVVVFLLGLLLGLLLRASALGRLRKQLLVAEQEKTDFKTQFLAANEKQKALSREVETLSREKVAVLEQLEGLRQQPKPAIDASWAAQRAAYEDRIAVLENEVAQRAQDLAAGPQAIAADSSTAHSANTPPTLTDYL